MRVSSRLVLFYIDKMDQVSSCSSDSRDNSTVVITFSK